MGKPTGFLERDRETIKKRPVAERVADYAEVEPLPPAAMVVAQAARCMDCGVPFCHGGCPLANLIPEWNDLVYRGHFDEAVARLEGTNNFPEITGRVCPAPCEAACVLAIGDRGGKTNAVSIKAVELHLSEHARRAGFTPQIANARSKKRVAIVGSGPAGLACAQQLARAGHDVVVFEKADRPGGLLRYGIPDFKMEKGVLDERLLQLRQEGVVFECGAAAFDDPGVTELVMGFDAVGLAIGAQRARALMVPGADLDGVVAALDYLETQNRVIAGDLAEPSISAHGKHVVILGGGDTGADCLGTAHRQGAASVTQIEIADSPPIERAADNPWPRWPRILRVSGAHEEGGVREFALETTRLEGEAGAVKRLVARRGDSELVFDAELVLLAMGFTGPLVEPSALLDVPLDARGLIATDSRLQIGGGKLFAMGDARVGASLVVTAIAEGRRAAASIDAWLAGALALRRSLPLAG
jgi:glutamate synthase (NADPH/NADH) small chain